MRELGNTLFLWVALLLIIVVLVPILFLTCSIRFLAEGVIGMIDCFEEGILVPVTNFMQAEVDKENKQ